MRPSGVTGRTGLHPLSALMAEGKQGKNLSELKDSVAQEKTLVFQHGDESPWVRN